MASIRKRGENSYLLVVSRGYDYQGKRLKPAQKTVHPPKGLTAKQTEKWLNEQAVLYEREVKRTPGEPVNRSITLAKYIDIWLEQVAPKKLAASTLVRDKQDIRTGRQADCWLKKQWRASIPVFAGSCPMQWRQGISRTILHGGHTGRKARRRSGRWRMRKQCKGLSQRRKARA
ncbi:hypothetical protein [Ruthenibacterium lactatiformans]|uniref:hypothetical protein n=1 Tax=Ruthenibacterium lactatiformans TaxID=1550024 RepID=UPI00242A497B|nr:hypothetical protein [Ruthenibacterium lactatiformans]